MTSTIPDELFIPERIKNQAYRLRLSEELAVIKDKEIIDIFLYAQKIIRVSKKMQIPHYIRGSSICSLVCYVLGLSDIDPIEHRLPFCRFINAWRNDQPDIDIDFPAEDRETIFTVVHKIWGNTAARFSTHITYCLRSALREYVRDTLGIKTMAEQTSRCNKLLSPSSRSPELEIYLAATLGTVKTYGLHGSGVVIRPEGFASDIIYRQIIDRPSGMIQLTLDKTQISQRNWPKLDILANSGLSQLKEIWRTTSNKRSDNFCEDYPHNDSKTWRLIQSGDLFGLTFGESRLMTKMVKAVCPEKVEEIAICLSLIRPSVAFMGQRDEIIGVISKNKKQFYLDRQKYLIFDDDIITFIQTLLHCDDAEAEYYRKGFQKSDKMLIATFIRKYAVVLGDSGSNDSIMVKVKQLIGHSSHSFCHAHALILAHLIFALAYEKVHQPQQFWSSTINHYHGEYRPWVIYREAKHGGWCMKQDQLPNGCWTDDDFLPGCFVRETSAGKIDFRGLIATYKTISTDANGQIGKIHLTIGYDNKKYLDLVYQTTNMTQIESQIKAGYIVHGCAVFNKNKYLVLDDLVIGRFSHWKI